MFNKQLCVGIVGAPSRERLRNVQRRAYHGSRFDDDSWGVPKVMFVWKRASRHEVSSSAF